LHRSYLTGERSVAVVAVASESGLAEMVGVMHCGVCPCLRMVRMNVRVDVTPMRHDGTTALDAPGVCLLISAFLSGLRALD
jgi:hypothetical protein